MAADGRSGFLGAIGVIKDRRTVERTGGEREQRRRGVMVYRCRIVAADSICKGDPHRRCRRIVVVHSNGTLPSGVISSLHQCGADRNNNDNMTTPKHGMP